jgi:hypothetical protein
MLVSCPLAEEQRPYPRTPLDVHQHRPHTMTSVVEAKGPRTTGPTKGKKTGEGCSQ